jgi:hypothetical protein
MWTPPTKSAAAKATTRRNRIESKLQNGTLTASTAGVSDVSLKAKFKGEFTRRMQRVARKAGLIHEIQVWDLHHLQAFSGIAIYRLAPGAI